jgi:hypothetical protein
MEALVAKHPARHGLRRTLMTTLRDTHDDEAVGRHIDALLAAGVATAAERADRARVRQGLPLMPRQ